jgi:hypothetical protein
MAVEIVDGSGTGNRAKVNDSNQLETLSVVTNRVADVSLNTEKAHLIASDFISLTTTASFSGLLYIKNTGSKNLYIQTIRTCSDATGSIQLRIISNPTTGTLISDANNADSLSSNLASSINFDGDAYSASGDGKTVTNGANFTQFINKSPGHSIQDYQGAIVIPKGKSMAITCKPSVATTICVEVQCWFE